MFDCIERPAPLLDKTRQDLQLSQPSVDPEVWNSVLCIKMPGGGIIGKWPWIEWVKPENNKSNVS
jgi:hypothetical protein